MKNKKFRGILIFILALCTFFIALCACSNQNATQLPTINMSNISQNTSDESSAISSETQTDAEITTLEESSKVTDQSSETETEVQSESETELEGESEIESESELETESESDSELETESDAAVEWSGTALLFDSGKTDYTIVIPNSASTTVKNAANKLKTAIKDSGNTTVNVKDENYYKLVNGGSIDGPKIVVGVLASDEASQAAFDKLYISSYNIFVDNESLYIIGGSDAATSDAIDYFINQYLTDSVSSLSFEKGTVKSKLSVPRLANLKISDNPASKYVIVHNGSAISKKYALQLQKVFEEQIGKTLEVVPDTVPKTTYEILVGKTNRTESISVRSNYSRPNVYYDIKTVGEKLVIMGEGNYTLEKAIAIYTEKLNSISNYNYNITGSVADGDVMNEIDDLMLQRANGTDLRVLHYNMAAPYLLDENAVYTSNEERAEIIADMILAYFPDLITTDEFYNSKSNPQYQLFYKTFMKEVSEYYYILDDSPYDTGKPAGAEGDWSYGISENILYKKSAGLTVVCSGWRYPTTKNDAGDVQRHLGYHSVVFKTANNKAFILSVGHYGNSSSDDSYAVDHHQSVVDTQAKSGISGSLPTILTGDMFTKYGKTGYQYHEQKGFSDSQRTATQNCNLNSQGEVIINHSTFHTIGVRQVSRVAEDFVWYNSSLKALKFKVIASDITDKTSDHYPVCADLKFK